MVILEVVYNLAILASISVLSGFIDFRATRTRTAGKVLQGLLFGIAITVGMLHPFVLSEGIFFDGRSVIISVCALFFGPVSGMIAVIFALTTRAAIGGAGLITGIMVIISSLIIGLLFHYYQHRKSGAPSIALLLIMGLIVHINMLGWMFFLPSNILWITFQTITVTVMVFFPFATVIIGKVLSDQLTNAMLIQNLRESEEKFKAIFNSTSEAIFIHDAETAEIIELNDRTLDLYKFKAKSEALHAFTKRISANNDLYNNETTRKKIKLTVTDGPQTFEWLARKKSGELFWVEISLRYTKIGAKGYVIAVARDINERKLNVDRIANSLHEKEILLAEIHHRVKNNLAIISSLITLQIDSINDETSKKLLQETDNRVRSIALVHELVYNNDDFSTIDFGAFLRELVPILDTLNNIHKCDVRVDVQAKNPLIDLNTSIPCALLVNELITNAYKHAFVGMKNGLIQIFFEEKDNEYSLTVKDSGIGIDDISRIKTSESLGYTIIQGLASQLQGDVIFDNTGVGLTVTITFSKKDRKH